MRIRMSQKQTFPHYFTLKVTSSGHVPDGTEPADQIRYIFVYDASSMEWKSLTIQTFPPLSLGWTPTPPIAHIVESASVIRFNKLDCYIVRWADTHPTHMHIH